MKRVCLRFQRSFRKANLPCLMTGNPQKMGFRVPSLGLKVQACAFGVLEAQQKVGHSKQSSAKQSNLRGT